MDINFLVKRETFTDKRTLGKMYVNGGYICDTLEDKDRKLETAGASAKVYAQTAILREMNEQRIQTKKYEQMLNILKEDDG